jgi:hypothetical protein
MPRVNIGNLPTINFPDTMSDEMIAEEIERQHKKFSKVQWPPPDKPEHGIGEWMPEPVKAVVGRLGAALVSGPTGLAAAPIRAITGEDPEWVKQAREWAATQRRWQQQVAPSFATEVVSGAAEMVPSMALMSTPATVPLGAAYFSGLGAENFIERMEQSKAKGVKISPEMERYGPLIGGALGGGSAFLYPQLGGKVGGMVEPLMTEAIPGVLGRFGSRFIGGAVGGAAQSGVQSTAENIGHRAFDPTRTFLESAQDIGTQTAYGGLAGGLIHGLIGKNYARRTAAEREIEAVRGYRSRDFSGLTDQQLDFAERLYRAKGDERALAFLEGERVTRGQRLPPEPEAPTAEPPPAAEPVRASLAPEAAEPTLYTPGGAPVVRPGEAPTLFGPMGERVMGPEPVQAPMFEPLPQPEGRPAVVGERRRLLIRHLNRLYGGIGMRNVALRLQDALTSSGGAQAEGLWDAATKSISVALNHLEPGQGASYSQQLRKGYRILTEEVWHSLKALGLIRGRDVRLVRRELEKATTRMPGTDESYPDWAKRVYGKEYGDLKKPQEAIDEEAEARLVSHWAIGAQKPPTPAAGAIARRVDLFFERLNNAMHLSGFRTMDDFIDMLESGEVRGRRRNFALPKNLFGRRIDAGQEADEEAQRPALREPNPEIDALASSYLKDTGITRPPLEGPRDPQEGYLRDVADLFQRAPHTPRNPQTREAYEALIGETGKQFERLGALNVEAWQGQGEPYKNSAETMADIRKGHLWFLPTETAYGEGQQLDNSHPLLQPTEYKLANGRPLLANDVFRIVHDVFGHSRTGNTFGPKGEYNAFLDHSRMYSDKALPALASETLAQNAWVNFGEHLRRPDGTIPQRGDPDYVPPQQRPFADQKAFAMPMEMLRRDPNEIRYSKPDPLTEAVGEPGPGAPGPPAEGQRASLVEPEESALGNAVAELHQKFPVNPDNPQERIFVAQGRPVATLEFEARGGRLRLRTLRSLEPGQGVGSLVLDRIAKVADKHGVTLEGTASPYGPEATRLNKDQLLEWYGRRGFQPEPGHDPALGYIIREPQTRQRASLVEPEERRVSFEVAPGEGSRLEQHLPNLHAVNKHNPALAQKITEELAAPYGRLAERVSGAKVVGRSFGQGLYLDYPPMASGNWSVLGTPEEVGRFANAMGYYGEQTEVLASRIDPAGKAQGVDITSSQPQIFQDPKLLQEFWQRLRSKLPEGLVRGALPLGDGARAGIRAVDLKGSWTPENFQRIIEAAQATGAEMNVDLRADERRVNISSYNNNWKENPNGEVYLLQHRQSGTGRLDGEDQLSVHTPERDRYVQSTLTQHIDNLRKIPGAEPVGGWKLSLAGEPEPPLPEPRRLTLSPSYDITKAKIFDRLDISEPEKVEMSRLVGQWEQAHPEREAISFPQIEAEARAIDPALVAQLRRPQRGHTLDPAMRFAARQRLNALVDEIHKRRIAMEVDMPEDPQARMAEEAQLVALERDAQGLTDVLLPTRSQDGRNLAYHRMMANSTWDAEYWLSRARATMGLPPGATVPEHVAKKINIILGEGQAAEQEAVERIRGTRKAPEARTPEQLNREQMVERMKKRLKDQLAGRIKKEETHTAEFISPEERAAFEEDPDILDLRARLAQVRGLKRFLKMGSQGRESKVIQAKKDLIKRLRQSLQGKKLGPDPVSPEERAMFEQDPEVLRLRSQLAAKRAAEKVPVTPEMRIERGVARKIKALEEKAAGVTRQPGEWALTPEERKAVENDERVKAARIKLARQLSELDRMGWAEIFTTLRKAGFLTGVKTSLRNIGGNLSVIPMEEAAHLPASVIDMAMSLYSGHRTVQGPSAKAMAQAGYAAATKGIREAWEVMRHGASLEDLAKMELPWEKTSRFKVLDWYTKGVFRFMAAQDKVFKRYAIERSLREQAALKAKNQGGSAQDHYSNATAEMQTRAIADSEYATFNEANELTDKLSAAREAWRHSPKVAGQALAVAMDVEIPFMRTPANIVKRVIEFSPGGALFAGSGTYEAIANKALTPDLQRKISLAMGRGMVGSALMVMGYQLAKAGLMTGLTDDPAEAARNEAAGRTPGSIRVPGTNDWRQISAFSPAGNLLTIGATAFETSTRRLTDELKRPWKYAGIGARTVMEQPFLKGMQSTLEFLAKPERRSESYLASQAGSVVPSFVKDIAVARDQWVRKPEGMLEGVKERIPGLREQVPTRFDVLGRPMEQRLSGVFDPTMPQRAQELTDPVIRELVNTQTNITRVSKSGKESPGETDARARLTGSIIYNMLQEEIASPEYRGLQDAGIKREVLDKVIRQARNEVSDFKKEILALSEKERIAEMNALYQRLTQPKR